MTSEIVLFVTYPTTSKHTREDNNSFDKRRIDDVGQPGIRGLLRVYVGFSDVGPGECSIQLVRSYIL